MKILMLSLFVCLSISLYADTITSTYVSASCGGDSDPFSSSIYCSDGSYADASASASWGSLSVSAVANGSNGYEASADAYASSDLGWFRFFGGKGQAIAIFSAMGLGSDYGTGYWSYNNYGPEYYDGGYLYIPFTFGVPFKLGISASAWAGDSGYMNSISTYDFTFGDALEILNENGQPIYEGKWYYDNGDTVVPEPSTFALVGLASILIGVRSRSHFRK